MIRARERVMAPIREMLIETGITEQQWRVLRVLTQSGPLDSSDLAEQAALLAPSLTRIIKTLVARGFVTRTQDSEDRRRQRVMITDEGQRIIQINRPQAARIAAQFRDKLGAENYETLLDLLEMLCDFRPLRHQQAPNGPVHAIQTPKGRGEIKSPSV